MSMSEQRSIKEYYPLKRKREHRGTEKRRKVSEDDNFEIIPGGVNLRDSPSLAKESFNGSKFSLVTDTPDSSTSSHFIGVLPMAPEPLSRGRKLVELARQKAISNTPTKIPRHLSPSRNNDEFVSSRSVYKRVRMTAKRKLILGSSDASVQSRSTPEKKSNIVETSPRCREPGPRLHEFGAIEFESPTKKGKIRSSDRALPLPETYKVLIEKFHCTDSVVGMFANRKEVCTFTKLRNAVEKMTRRQLKKCNLAQIKTVYPTAFLFAQERNIPGDYNDRMRYQLTISRNGSQLQTPLSSSDLVHRRKVFSDNLTSIARSHHCNFLSHLNPPLEIPDHKVLRWHPEFSLDTIPEVEEADLPSAPVVTGSMMSPKDFFPVDMATQNLKPKYISSPVATKVPALNPVLDGISNQLLDKIRAKENCKAALCISRSSIEEKRLERIQKLPAFVSILRGYFIAEKKAAILWDEVVKKLSESHRSHLAPDHVEEHLNLLCELCKDLIKVVHIRKRKYVKLDKNMDTKLIFNTLDKVRRDLEL